MSNYINLTSKNANPYRPRKANGQEAAEKYEVNAWGQGSGMLGLPGDFTSPSRFVRAAALSQSVAMVQSAPEGVNLAWNLINNVDIAVGTVQFSDAELAEGAGSVSVDYTQWVSVTDLGDLRYYYRTYDNQNIRVASLEESLKLIRQKAGNDWPDEQPLPVMVIPMNNARATYHNVTSELMPVKDLENLIKGS